MAASEHPNIIVLITDTFRRDNLGTRAVRPVRTPALDRFAAERATELTGLTMSSFPTIPHRTDFASGRVGWPHYGWQPISHSTPNHIASLLAERGYFTQLICDCPHLFKSGFQVGFHGSYQHRGQEGDLTLLHMNDPIREAMPRAKTRLSPETLGGTLIDLHMWLNDIRAEADTFCAQTAQTTATWLERNYQAGPFFPVGGLLRSARAVGPARVPGAALRSRLRRSADAAPQLRPRRPLHRGRTAQPVGALRGRVGAGDRHIGRVLEKIDDLDLWRNSLVVVMADHGMAVGEHNCCGKSNITDDDGRFWPLYPVLSDELCLIAGNAQAGPVPAGAQLDLRAQPFDLLPTLSELAGVEIAPPQPLQGRSFANQVMTGGGSLREHVITAAHARPAAATPDQLPAQCQHAVPAHRRVGLRAGRPGRRPATVRPGR